MWSDGTIAGASGSELSAAVAGVYACFLGREPEAVTLSPAHFGARVRVRGGRSLLEQALLEAGRDDLFREGRDALTAPMAEALQLRAERVLDVPIEVLRIDSDPASDEDIVLLVLAEPPVV